MNRKTIRIYGNYYDWDEEKDKATNAFHIIKSIDRVPVGSHVFMTPYTELFEVQEYVEDVEGKETNWMSLEEKGCYVGKKEDIGVKTKSLGQPHFENLSEKTLITKEYTPHEGDFFFYDLLGACQSLEKELRELTGCTEWLALHGPFRWVSGWAMSGACYGSDYFNEWEWEGKIWDQDWYPSNQRDLRLYLNTLMPKDEIWVANDWIKGVLKLKGEYANTLCNRL